MELLIVFLIITVLLVLGVPSFQAVILDYKLITRTNHMVSLFNLARSEAIKRGTRVIICQATSLGCNMETTGIWDNGWIIYIDINYNGNLDANEAILLTEHYKQTEISIRTSSRFTKWVGYQSDGVSIGSTNLGNGTFRICDRRGVGFARFIVVNVTGRVRIRKNQYGDFCP